ncbi:AAA family ATPase [uncultured Hymenobacter sp.]|uniref:AAA family ATPase n=1 Tax=uncultured Hymenobacter sp. TaxID=170016 RepID=UPI0035CC450C
MPTRAQAPPAVPRLTYLRDVEFRDLAPLTVLIGPNGSGESTVLNALDFLAEAARGNTVQAWEKRNRFARIWMCFNMSSCCTFAGRNSQQYK